MRKHMILATVLGLAALASGVTAASAAEVCPSPSGKTVKVDDVVFKIIAMTYGLGAQVTMGSYDVPENWTIGCIRATGAGKGARAHVFVGPQAGGARVFAPIPKGDLGKQCSPAYDVGEQEGADELPKWPGKWKQAITLHLRTSDITQKRMYVPDSWKPGCAYVHQFVRTGNLIAYYMGDPYEAPPVVKNPEIDNKGTEIVVTVEKPVIPRYSRDGKELKKSYDDFVGAR